MSDDNDGGVPNLAAVQNRMDALKIKIGQVQDELEAEREAREELEAALEERDRRLDALEEQLAAIDQRTDLLDFARQADEASGRQRSIALLLDLKSEAEASDGPDTHSFDRDAAERALRRPDVDRTTIYDDMRRAARIVGDEDVCAYADGVLRLNLDQGELPSEVLAQRHSEVSR